ncbi:aminopeptidase P family protein [Verrucomicrobiaceae bacterium 5K15]|uniref:Aminopeptidase P family protein n=1 Tax=Oceaniferula flava TaxID=2800421 RepID=A0AAE2SBB0_9BACT|nr:Xaa-Pro peptidase family protein [Oceaniferula flavus]MBK1855046.1 aminopeptidase P family protein [Oceaniferula flavus]MBM1136352.1 aminopeptidase P family protein [Oceaniferula flavus]
MTQTNLKSPQNMPTHAESILFHADSNDPDLLYFSGFKALDPYIAFSIGQMKVGVVHSSEYGRMVAESDLDEILLVNKVNDDAARHFKLPKGQQASLSQMIIHLAEVYQIPRFRIGERFPAGLALELQQAGVEIQADKNGGVCPEREIKKTSEVESLRRGNRASEAGFRVVHKTLTESKIVRGQLVHQGKVLTSERLRELISHAALDEGAVALHTIASCGDQVHDNHNTGYGPILANQLIVVDIFPQRIDDHYWGDMTRTFLKGQASDAQRRLVRTVKKGHELAISMIKPGQVGGEVHDAVQAFFDKEGYETVRDSENVKGFFHALGHGVGLEIHENPFMRSKAPWKFKEGHVITVEPGLYYLGLGGCRIEDVVHVTPGGNELISHAPYTWEIQ